MMDTHVTRLAFGLLSCLLYATLLAHESLAARTYQHNAIKLEDTPTPPTWEPAYALEFQLSLPQYYLTQPQGLVIPARAWYDGVKQRSKISLFDDTDTTMFLKSAEYDIHPRIDKMRCWKWANAEGAASNGATPLLPDLHKWQYAGTVELDGRPAYIWQSQFKEGDLVSSYNFYTDASTGHPVKYHMIGANQEGGAHYDEYIYEFSSYAALPASEVEGVFALPELCKDPVMVLEHSGRPTRGAQLRALMPAAHAPRHLHDAAHEAAYAQWSAVHARSPASTPQEYMSRLQRFRTTAARVAAHNARPNKTYSMTLGRFADWYDDEFYAVMLPDTHKRRAARRGAAASNGLDPRAERRAAAVPGAYDPLSRYKRKLPRSKLPKAVDWRGTGADPGVKDQGMCGSCWSFGATGTMEGTWYVETGEHRSFSEQQLMDCSYEWGPRACDGGDARPGINYIAHNGGAALEQDYTYRSSVDFCRSSNHTSVGLFEGFLEIRPREEADLMEAVAVMGPISVAMDASLDSFRYYKEGVYDEAGCSRWELDHQVMLYGYGTTDTGIDYWLVKNSWSKLYGTDGFIRIVRGAHDCGISSEPSVAVVAAQYKRPG
eukprot:CAMPEP_0202919314 /NCGR_PEP_ID=MMETSP1392-20130828/75519_1 /ASSEMBLY_ACC=CAM_ASM_000868 /TAXON_ID=225041 /ORGANISM="Chlamydomonas chlamydogama, Strain SAG 11-48b" /LENGTH=602 /DNA_ID=CAMNT_0049612635 /DNA_START=31 /DNA_END=1836 /DNA_ORIENTATION=-